MVARLGAALLPAHRRRRAALRRTRELRRKRTRGRRRRRTPRGAERTLTASGSGNSCLGRVGQGDRAGGPAARAGTGGSAWRRWRASRPARWSSARSASSTTRARWTPDEIERGRTSARRRCGKALRERRGDDPDRPVFTVPVALSLMVFFALCCQCASTLAVIRRETRQLGVAGVHVRVHDGAGLRRGAGRRSRSAGS